MSENDTEKDLDDLKSDSESLNKSEDKQNEQDQDIGDTTSYNQVEISLDSTNSFEKLDDNTKNQESKNESIDTTESIKIKIHQIITMKDNIDIKYGLLIGLIKVEQIEKKDIYDAVLNLLVNGPFDMQQNFMIHSSQCVIRMLEVIEIVEWSLKAELLSVLIGILRKSKCNLKMTIGTNIISKALEMSSNCNGKNADEKLVKQFIIDLLGIVAQFSISVKELRSLMKRFKQENNVWPHHSVDLLKVLQQMPTRTGPDDFFNFPGSKSSAIAIPPISKWPYQNGWSINCWVHLDSASANNSDRDTPFLYCFRTNKGLGYSANFVGNSLVITTMKMKDKGVQFCTKYNFQPRKWYMITVVYVYNRWSKSEIRCYIEGQLNSQVEISWQINTNDSFDRCFIGASPDMKPECMLTGQISCIYGFTESLNPHQIASMYALGASYHGNFKFETEGPSHLLDHHKKTLFEGGRLSSCLMFSYNPVACDRQLCLNQAPSRNATLSSGSHTGSGASSSGGGAVSVFAHSSHALMMNDVQAVLTQSIYSTLHSLGGIRILYPLFAQIDCKYILDSELEDAQVQTLISEKEVPNICGQLIRLLSRLLLTSAAVRQQLVQSRGFLLISQYISRSVLTNTLNQSDASSSTVINTHLNTEFLEALIDLCGTLSLMHLEHVTKKYQYGSTNKLESYTNKITEQFGTGPTFKSAPVGTKLSAQSASSPPQSVKDESLGISMINSRNTSHVSTSPMLMSAGGSHSLELIKHIYDYILSNTALWIYAEPEVQLRLYRYLCEDFLSEGVVFNKTRCINAVLQYLYAIKYYYWLVDPENRSGITSKKPENAPTLTLEQTSNIRTSILMFLKKLMLKCHSGVLDEELQGILNYLTVVNEDENLGQVLYFCVTLMSEQPSTMVPAFDRKNGIPVVFKLLGSGDETIRIMALKLLGFYLQRSTLKRKQDSMGPYNLYSLIGERILLNASHLTIPVYNALYEILVESSSHHIVKTAHQEPERNLRLENPLLLKVIAHLIHQSKITTESIKVHKIFLADLTKLCINSRENKRTVLQMSVWQDWLFLLAPLMPVTHEDEALLNSVISLVRILLHHAIQYEFGGWRVWIDTLAILHWKVEYGEFFSSQLKNHRNFHSQYSQQSHDNNSFISNHDNSDPNQNNTHHYPVTTETPPPEVIDLAESVAKHIINDIVVEVCKDKENDNSKTGDSGSVENPQKTSPLPRSQVPFRIPEFNWSPLHQRLLHDLLWTIEQDLKIWERTNNRVILDFVNNSDNHIYLVNLVHLVTMLSDTLITCCGGLLPLLAAATSPTGDVDMLENNQGMRMSVAVSFLLRVMNITDIVVFASNVNFSDLEHEKNTGNGVILKQCLRLVCTCAVRNCLENRFRELHFQLFNDACQQHQQQMNPHDNSADAIDTGSVGRLNLSISEGSHAAMPILPPDPLQELIRGLRPKSIGDSRLDDLQSQNYPIADPQVLLQEMDINRLRAVIYRDVEESKQAQFLALAVVYFLSVLMVSRYRDLLEPPPSCYSYSDDENEEEEDEEEEEEENLGDDNSADNYDEGEKLQVKSEQTSNRNKASDTSSKYRPSSSNSAFNDVDDDDITDENAGRYEDDEECEVGDDIYAREISVESDGRKSRISGELSPTQISTEVTKSPDNNINAISAINVSQDERTVRSTPAGADDKGDSPVDFTMSSKLPDFPQSSRTKKHQQEEQRRQKIMQDNEASDDDDDNSQNDRPNSSAATVPIPPSDLLTSSNLTKRLEQALGGSAPLIREIFFDFSTFLSRTLVGSHGQELVSSGLLSLRQSTSVVEMVMLLCSQEWQNSLQKHAGKAFIELVNEGRVMSHASRDHTVRVANEAHFILSRMRAEDVQKHAEYTRQCAISRQQRGSEERVAEHMIAGARARDDELGTRLESRLAVLIMGRHGLWSQCSGNDKDESELQDSQQEFFRLDSWEDDSRRRRRFVPNPWGSSHPEATLTRQNHRDVSKDTDQMSVAHDEDRKQLLEDAMKQWRHQNQIGKTGNGHPEAGSLEGIGGNLVTGEDPGSYGVTDEELMRDVRTNAMNRPTGGNNEDNTDNEKRLRDSNGARLYPQRSLEVVRDDTNLELEIESDDDEQEECSISESTVAVVPSANNTQTSATSGATQIAAQTSATNANGATQKNMNPQLTNSSSVNKSNTIDNQKMDMKAGNVAGGSKKESTTSSMNSGQLSRLSSTSEKLGRPVTVHINGPVIYSTPAILLAPGVNVHGLMSITKFEFYFEMDPGNKNNIGLDKKVLCYLHHLHGKWHFSEIRAVFSRKFLHRNLALEIFVANRTSVMFALPDQDAVRRAVSYLPRVGVGLKYGVPQHRKSSLASPRQLFRLASATMTVRWQQRDISNFDYLMFLNTVAGRTFNDLNQYPIFPWVLSNYDESCGDTIDLTSPANYRDLASPIGALNPTRKKFFDERYKNWDDDSQPAFHYGTHYSTAAFVLNYLVRIEPFSTFFLNLQSGKFDHADRTFHSIGQTWKNCQRDSSDVKELIPEFFYLPEMFTNQNRYRFGVTDDGTTVNDVILPNWAKSPEDFIRIHRMALESEFVSSQLHHWIDLIFGYKQRGPEAVRATNVFCYLTYEGSVNWEQISDPILRQALEDQIRSFGQTPSQLLTEPHPPRNSALHVSPLMFTPVHTDLLMVLKFVSNSPLVWLAANLHSHGPMPAVITVSANYHYGVNRWNPALAVSAQTSVTSLASTLPLTTPNTTSTHQTNNGSGYPATVPTTSSVTTNETGLNQNKSTHFVTPNVQLPLVMDPMLLNPSQMPRRSLGDGFDVSLTAHNHQFTCSIDNRVLFATGFWDKSFRVFSTDNGKLMQVVYGHFGVVTCIARSECGFGQDFYMVTGSTDCTVMLWLWGHRNQALLGDFNCRETAQPRMTITGHQSEITCLEISGELGIIASGSKDRCLLHSLQGELLHSLPISAKSCIGAIPNKVLLSREGWLLVSVLPSHLLLFTINGKFLGSTSSTITTQSIDKAACNTSMALSRDNEYVVVGSDNGSVCVRRTYDLELVHEFPRCDSSVRSIALATDQRFIITGLSNGSLVVFNIDFYKWHHEFRDRYPAL